MKHTASDANFIIHCFSPLSYWHAIKSNCKSLPWEIIYKPDDVMSFLQKAKKLEQLEQRVWSVVNPSFVRTNFGLFGPGVILMAEYRKKIVGSIYFTGPSVFNKEILIWTLIVDSRYRNLKIASKLLTSTLYAVQNYAKHIVIQTKTNSDALGLYLKLGPNKIAWCQSVDTGSWKKPKIGLEIAYPRSLDVLLEGKKHIIYKKDTLIKVRDDDVFWKHIGMKRNLWGKIGLVDIISDEKGKILFLKKSNALNYGGYASDL